VATQTYRLDSNHTFSFNRYHDPGYLGAQDTFYVGTLKGVRADLPADIH
jgi:hypothetical protein